MAQKFLLTGITGFIAKRIALDLLNEGHEVRGSLRSPGRADEVRAALVPHLADPRALDRLEFVTLDLGRDEGWAEALSGVDALVHTAAPFPLTQPKSADEIIKPTVDGTLRALGAARAAGVTRVVMTSSVVAILSTDKTSGAPYTEADWSELDHATAIPYVQSKTLAERAAWEFVEEHPEMRLTTINPALVLGAPLDTHWGTSLQVVERILSGRDPMLPQTGFSMVDVADVSAMHLSALARPETAGKRYIAAAPDSFRMMPEIGKVLKAAFPDRRIPTRTAPNWLIGLLGLFDPSVATIRPTLGLRMPLDPSAAQRDLGIAFTPWETALRRSADAILAKS